MKVLKPLIVLIIAILTLSMGQSDRKELVQACAEKAGAGAIYLRKFIVSLPRAVKNQPPPVYRQAVILRGNNIYRFNLCDERGRAIIRIYDSSNMVVSSYISRTRKELNPLNFLCRKTGQYTIMINFRYGRSGETVAIMSHVLQ